MSTPAWESDPTTRHEYRWWDGERWTDYVADDGVQSLDPLTGAERLGPPKDRPAPTSREHAEAADQSMSAFGQPMQLASRAARFGARFIDFVVLFAFMFCVLSVLHFTDVKPIPIEDSIDLDAYEAYYESLGAVIWFLFAAAAIYEIALTATRGQTLGKMATRIMVVRADDLFQAELGRPPSWGRSLLRWGLPSIVGFVPFIGWPLALVCYLSLTWDRERQGWHDKVANTFVLAKP
ncbi:RDD family protein [Candidatus Poriferisocius sp.]|uniref:RDD family protein n=1 Tax=Candidatus Poriferisocius sp. TaxID=3101276 RepID=UPI003B0191A0